MLLVGSQRAHRLAQRQVEFVAAVSHELRTPLAAIGSLGQNLADGLILEPEQVRRYGALIQREGSRLGSMVEQVLELSGILSGRRAPPLQPTELADLVEGALEDCRGLIAEKGARVEIDLPGDLPRLAAEPASLRRAVANLLGNAVKHGGERPWARISARIADDRHGARLLLTVADRGPGILPEDLPHLFEPFYRGKPAREGQIPGSGLGLALVRLVALAHGGAAQVDTSGGEGSVFTLALPVAGPPPDGEAHPAG
jgi:signal transduction histidine kinase